MELRNTLYMSTLLVGGFFCLYFYQESITKEFDAHNYVLNEIIKKQKEQINPLTNYHGHIPKHTKEERTKTQKLKSDYNIFNDALDNPSVDSNIKIIELLNKYNIEHNLDWRSKKLSLITQNRFYDEIETRLLSIQKELIEKEQNLERNNIKVIVKERKESYEVGKNYDLDLQAVVLHNDYLDHAKGSYIINKKEHALHKFPLELYSKPDSITFLSKGTNKVTGEKFNFQEHHALTIEKNP